MAKSRPPKADEWRYVVCEAESEVAGLLLATQIAASDVVMPVKTELVF